MLYAVIADVHANIFALKAVLADAEEKGVQGYFLLGDYARDTPYQNDVLDILRNLPNCTAVLGNGDIGIISHGEAKQGSNDIEQLAPKFWAHKNISKENMDYLKSLPETADIPLLNGKTIHLSHDISIMRPLEIFHSSGYARRMQTDAFTFEEGIKAMQADAETYSQVIAKYQGDIFLFGHNHLQFHGEVAGKVLLNPGACGMPADYDIRAPYALLNTPEDENGEVQITLCRVPYDVSQTIKATSEFAEYPHAKFWAKMRTSILSTGSDLAMSLFWKHASEICGGRFPMENHLWRKALLSFDFDAVKINSDRR